MTMWLLEYGALAIGTLGSVLWSLGKNQLSVSILWLISAMLWIAFAVSNEHYGLTARDCLGVFLYAIGIRTYWKGRKVKSLIVDAEAIKQESLDCLVCNNTGIHQMSGPGTSICGCRCSYVVAGVMNSATA